MRKVFCIAILVILVLSSAFCVSAASGITSQTANATVSADGRCQVAMSVTLHLEQPVSKLYFPLPADAGAVALNGGRVLTSKADNARKVDISRLCKNVVGDVTFHIQYTVYDVIHTNEAGVLELRMGLLAGFEYPVEKLEFTVNLPGEVTTLPGFVSGYHQARIEEHLTFQVNGATVTGSSTGQLKDHETLAMTLAVTEEMFPQTITKTQDYHGIYTAMLITAAVAVVYWLVFLWNLPVLFPKRQDLPPDGYSAGHMGVVAAGQGVDLTMLVFTWAQLGYVTMHLEKKRRVLLYRRMDMGNERSEFERRCFQKLFGGRNMVDTTSSHYANLSLQCAKKQDGMGGLLRKFSGNPKLFRLIVSGIGLFAGVGLAIALANGATLQGLLIALLAVLGAISGYHLQRLGARLLLGQWERVTGTLIVAAVWLVIGLLAGAVELSLYMIFGSLAGGVLLFWGGRRTAQGRLVLQQVCGLKKYLRRPDRLQLIRASQNDPDYFFRLAPYAMALGVDRLFAYGFGGLRLDGCPYLNDGIGAHMTAMQWAAQLRSARDLMDQRVRRMPLEQFMGLIMSMKNSYLRR